MTTVSPGTGAVELGLPVRPVLPVSARGTPRFGRDGVRHMTVKSPALRRRGDLSLYVPTEAATDGCDALMILLNGAYKSH